MKVVKCLLAGFLLISLSAAGAEGDRGRQRSEQSLVRADTTRPVVQVVYDGIVDVNGRGDFTSIQQAIDHAPEGRTEPWRIFIKNGRYEGLVRIPESKPYIFLIGEDRDRVMISFSINCGSADDQKPEVRQSAKENFNMKQCAVVVVESANFYSENITFENTYGLTYQSGPQALAIKTNNDRMAFYNCRFRSFQDTWMTSTKGLNDRTYADRCWIEGAVDYFYGGGNAYVENSTFYNVRSGSVIVAPAHRDSVRYGYVFQHCVIDGNKAAADGRSKLGRPWHHRPVAVFLNSTMKIPLAPEGWTDMGPAAKLFAEYNSRDAQGNLLDLSQRRTWYQQRDSEGGKRIEGLQAVLSEQQAAKYTYRNVVEGTDGWDPRAYFTKLDAPGGIKLTDQQISWQPVKGAAGYLVYRNGVLIGFTADAELSLEGAGEERLKGAFSVASVNRFGSFGSRSDAVTLNN